ncbi:MAG TPA: glutathione synthase, partial [Burkholderiaceae bacterium]|nr:glutathione synthase [Burkholderiaceae bacterium]
MPLNLLFIVDPLDHLKEYKDSTVAMMREAARRGHIVHACTPAELWFQSRDGLVHACAHQLSLTQQAAPWYVDQGLHEHSLKHYAAVL